MKKRIIFPMLYALLSAMPASAEEGIFVSYNYEMNSVSVSGNVGNAAGTLVTISITKADAGTMGSDNLPIYIRLYETGENGELNLSIPMSESTENGKYTVYVDSTACTGQYPFMLVNANNSDAESIIEKINNAASKDEMYAILSDEQNAVSLGLDLNDDVIKNNLGTVSDLCYEEKGNYDMNSLRDTLNKGIIRIMLNSDAELGTIIEKYASYFGTTYTEYIQKSIEEQNALRTLLEKADFTEGLLQDIYSEMCITAKVVVSQTWSELQETVLEYADEIGIDVGDNSKYDDIKKSNQYKVFTAMIKKSSKFENFEDICDAFDEAVSDALSTSSSVKGNGGGGGGGSSSGGNKFIGALPATKPAVNEEIPSDNGLNSDAEQGTVLSDIKEHWAKDYIENLLKIGVVSGYDDATFRPDERVTRAEFVKMVTKLFDIKSEETMQFTDVNKDAWYAQSVSEAVGAGLIKGYDGKFMPNDFITRQDVAVIIYRLERISGLEKVSVSEYGDEFEISDYAAEAVTYLTETGIINGDGGMFRPGENITRAEAAAIIWRAYEKCNNG